MGFWVPPLYFIDVVHRPNLKPGLLLFPTPAAVHQGGVPTPAGLVLAWPGHALWGEGEAATTAPGSQLPWLFISGECFPLKRRSQLLWKALWEEGGRLLQLPASHQVVHK